MALKDAIEALQPSLAGMFKVQDQLPTKIGTKPVIVIRPGRFPLQHWTPFAVRDSSGEPIFAEAGRPLVRVGSREGEIQLWLAARDAVERETVEDALTHAFQHEDAPGRLQTTVASVEVDGVDTGWNCPVTFFLGPGSEWRDEQVFAERRWAFLEVETSLPELALRSGEAKVTDMELIVDGDYEADISGLTSVQDRLDAIDDEEIYDVHENGTATPV